MYQHLTKLLLAGVIAVALLALGITSIVSPASAGKIKPGKLPLDGVCVTGQVAKWNAGTSTWTCADDIDTDTDTDTLGGLGCVTDEIAKWDGAAWVCAVPDAGPKVVFVTSGDFLGNLSGLDGADALCQAAAVAGDVPPGFYVAWLSTLAVDAIDRLTPGVSGYFLPSGIKVADDIADLTDGDIDHVIDEDEFGAAVGTVGVWTGTGDDGLLFISAAFTCSAWTDGTSGAVGAIGTTLSADGNWTRVSNQTCDTPDRHLYCFQK